MPDRDDTALHELAGVEVFRAGTWNGDAYSADDIDAMVAAFGEVGFRPPVKLGHAAAPGAPAYGWVKALRRAGERLIADLADLPGAVFEAIRARASPPPSTTSCATWATAPPTSPATTPRRP
ncbi:MAG: hypothetical protein HY521_15065 [Proteobacteria bacterium]|nr:hypothetical protein [Pseudomonadota bacterium]